MTKAQIEAARVLEGRRIAFAKRVRNLLGHVGQRTAQSLLDARFNCMSPADQVEYGPKADALAAELASVEPVGRALHPHKAEAVRSAREDAQQTIERVRKELEAAGWDQATYAPYPKGNRHSNPRHGVEQARYNLVSQLTTEDTSRGYQRYGAEPYFVKMDPRGIERFVDHACQDAAFQYDAFICKMVAKVGDVIDARLEGDHIWSHSFLYVTKEDGSTEKWKTQQIINYSVYGRPYLQWPSRKVK